MLTANVRTDAAARARSALDTKRRQRIGIDPDLVAGLVDLRDGAVIAIGEATNSRARRADDVAERTHYAAAARSEGSGDVGRVRSGNRRSAGTSHRLNSR